MANIRQLNYFIDKFLDKDHLKKLKSAILQARYRTRHKEKGENLVTLKIPAKVYDRISKMGEWQGDRSATNWLIFHLDGIWKMEKRYHRNRLKTEKRPPDSLIESEDKEEREAKMMRTRTRPRTQKSGDKKQKIKST